MAKIPAGASLLFGALADSGHIRQRKNGSYKMVLKGVDEINWFTDRPDRVEGKWKPRQLQRKWNSYFANGEPNAQAGFKADDEQEMVAFEMFKPKIKKGKMIFNIKSISDAGDDLITGLTNKELDDVSLFIDKASNRPACYPSCQGADLIGANLYRADLAGANLSDANLRGADLEQAGLFIANFRDADLTGADLRYAYLAYASLRDVHMDDAVLRGADLYGADMDGAHLTDADLDGADLRDAVLIDATLAGANLTDVLWKNTICPDGTNSNDPGNSTCGF